MFADVTTALDGTIVGVRRPEPAVLEFVRLTPGVEHMFRQVRVETSHIVFPRVEMVGDVAFCAFVTGHDDHARVANARGEISDLGVLTGGLQPIAVRRSAGITLDVSIVLPGGATYCQVLQGILGPALPVPLPDGRTSTGFLDWTAAGLVWSDAQRETAVGGRVLLFAMRRGDWTVGQDNSGRNRILAYRHSDGAWFVVPGWSQYWPRVAARPNGSCVVAVSSGLGEFVESARFVPLAADEDEPAGQVATFAPAPAPVRVQVFGGAGFRMGAGPQSDDISVPYSGAFVTLGRDDLARQVALARQERVPLYAYVDDVSFPPQWVPKVDGVTVIPTIQAYPHRLPGRPMTPIADTVDAIAATVHAMRATFDRVAVVMAFYRQIDGEGRYNWPLQHVLDLQREVWDIVRAYRLADVLIFHENRANGLDGIASRLEFREAERRIRAAAAAAPTPTPEPTPPVSRFPRARSLSHA